MLIVLQESSRPQRSGEEESRQGEGHDAAGQSLLSPALFESRDGRRFSSSTCWSSCDEADS